MQVGRFCLQLGITCVWSPSQQASRHQLTNLSRSLGSCGISDCKLNMKQGYTQFCIKGFLKVQLQMKLLVHSFLLKLALLGRKGQRELSSVVLRKMRWEHKMSSIKFCTFTYLYGTHHKSSYKYYIIIEPAKGAFNLLWQQSLSVNVSLQFNRC